MDRRDLPRRYDGAPSVDRYYGESNLTYLSPDATWQEPARVDPGAIWTILQRRRTTILISIVGVLAIVGVITLLMPVEYRSDATLLVETGDPQEDSMLAVLDRALSANSIETEMELIRSRRVVEPIVVESGYNVTVEVRDERRRVDRYFDRFEGSTDAVPGRYELRRNSGGGFEVRDLDSGELLTRTEADPDELRFAGITLAGPIDIGDEAVVQISSLPGAVAGTLARISVAPVQRDANLVRIECSGSTPEGAQELCRSVSDSYLDLRAELQQSEASAAAEFLAEQVAEVGQRLTEAEDELGEYQRTNQAVALSDRASSEVVQSAQLRAQVDELEAERRALEQLINRPGNLEDLASFPTFLRNENRVVGNLVQTLVELQNSRSELAVTRTDRNPDIIAIDSRIEAIQEQLRSFAVNYERSLGEQIRSLNSANARASGRLSEIPTKQVETARLGRQVALLEDLYAFLQTRLREAEVAKVVNLPSVRFVDEASMPTGKESPNEKINLGLGLLLGMGLGVILAFYRERTDPRIREQDEIERQTGIPVLTMIPKIKKPGAILPITRRAGDGSGNGRTGVPTRIPGVISAMTWEDEVALESFRSLATDLGFAKHRMANGDIRTICVTSSGRGDGKTFTACNLAVANANNGIRVLLIDADLRASGVSRFFELPWTSPGLTDVLLGEENVASVATTLSVGDREAALDVIPAGTPANRSAGMLDTYSSRLADLLQHGRDNYDLVIVDTPPLNVLTDATSIATRVEGVIVVVRGGYTDKAALEMTLKRLDRASAPVMGLVLNDVDLPASYMTYSQPYMGEDE